MADGRHIGYVRHYRDGSRIAAGGLFEHDAHILRLHDACMARGMVHYVDALFGGQPCSWHGGRVLRTAWTDAEIAAHMHKFLPAYTERGISCRLNFSNPHVTVRNLADKRANMMLDILAEYNRAASFPHGVISASDTLRKYVRDRHPELFMTASVLKTVFSRPEPGGEYAWYARLAGQYDMVVLKEEHAMRQDWMAGLEQKEKFEVILNSICIPDCRKNRLHYGLTLGSRYGERHRQKHDRLREDCARRRGNAPGLALTPEKAGELYSLGFRNFKLATRGLDWGGWMEMSARYLMEPGNLLLHYLELEKPEAFSGKEN